MKKKNGAIKISFIGDIMCEKPLLKSSFIKNGEYDFNEIFSSIKHIFENSDYVVGNLETVCAGKDMGYTNHIYNFNTPESFIKAIKNSGIDLVTTATNHCLDRGVEGLKNNLTVLQKYGLDSIGTYATPKEKEKLFYKDFNGIKVAFLNYTYGTNVHINEVILREDELFHVNLLKSQDEEIQRLERKKNSKGLKNKIARKVFNFITLEQWVKLKKNLGLTYNRAYQDNDLEGIDERYLKQIKLDIKKAKYNADFVVVCMHSGGQFNVKPGEFSQYMMNFMSENGVDVVVGNHPHVVQKYEQFSSGMLGTYSLGNFSISPSSVYLLHEDLPEYSIMLHLYLNQENRSIKKATFSILKITENEKGSLKVFSINELIQNVKTENEKEEIISNAKIIYNRFLNKNINDITIQEEYIIE